MVRITLCYLAQAARSKRLSFKVIYTKYSKHWPVAYTIDCVCSKMLNHGLNHGLFLSLLKLIPCPIHWILNTKAVLVLPKTAGSAHKHKSISFIWIFWSTLYVYLCFRLDLLLPSLASNGILRTSHHCSISRILAHCWFLTNFLSDFVHGYTFSSPWFSFLIFNYRRDMPRLMVEISAILPFA